MQEVIYPDGSTRPLPPQRQKRVKRPAQKKKRAPIQIPEDAHVTYQFQYRKCGKASCKRCPVSRGHGPYWYGYWRDNGVHHSKYFGKVHPESTPGTIPLVGI